MGANELKQARKLIRKKRYTAVIRILEPQVFRFRQDQHYYFLLGTAYLHTGDISGAATYLKRAIQLNPKHIQAMLSLAAVYLKQGDNQGAIEVWLKVLQKDKDNKTAKRGLSLLKKSSHNSEILEKTLTSNKFFSLLPSTGAYMPFYIPVIIILLIAVPLTLHYSPQIKGLISRSRPKRNSEVQKLEIDTDKPVISLTGSYHIILTEKEIEDALHAAKRDFNDFKDNEAQYEINRIKYSNAAESVKEKAMFIENFLSVPDFSNFSNTFSYRQVAADPLLFENCYIRWKGKTSNVSVTENSIQFDFLVGYQENKVLEGIVQCFFNFAVSIEQGAPVELLGKITVKDKRNNSFIIKGTAIRPLAPIPKEEQR